MYKYRTGIFISKKTKQFTYRSGYEATCFLKLEEDKSVINYVVEPFTIPYIDDGGKKEHTNQI